MDKAQALTGERFGWKWKQVPDYGFEEATAKFQKEWYIQKFGWGTEANLRAFLKKCKFVLDAGCGLGRDVNMYAQFTKGTVYGVDISESVVMAEGRLKNVPNIRFIQADMMELPFEDEYFDFYLKEELDIAIVAENLESICGNICHKERQSYP